jgi:hypothetical protein
LANQLFSVEPYDTASLVAGPAILMAVAAIACVPPVMGTLVQESGVALKDE